METKTSSMIPQENFLNLPKMNHSMPSSKTRGMQSITKSCHFLSNSQGNSIPLSFQRSSHGNSLNFKNYKAIRWSNSTDVTTMYSNSTNEKRDSIRRIHPLSKDRNAEWGWFTDIDSSNDSIKELSFQNEEPVLTEAHFLNELDHLCKNTTNMTTLTTVTTTTTCGDGGGGSAFKVFPKFNMNKEDNDCDDILQASIVLPKFRIVQSATGTDRHAEYFVAFQLGHHCYAGWRRYSEFLRFVKKLAHPQYRRSLSLWEGIDTRWFYRLEPSYLHKKCIALEEFLREVMYESNYPFLLIDFLGGQYGKIYSRSQKRPSAQLPKEMRPPQPQHERELFEKLWAENFKRSRVGFDLEKDVYSSSNSLKY